MDREISFLALFLYNNNILYWQIRFRFLLYTFIIQLTDAITVNVLFEFGAQQKQKSYTPSRNPYQM